MRAARKPESGAPNLTVPERVLLFCIAPDTDWKKAGVTGTVVTVRAAVTIAARTGGCA
jgi:hypothetical protein